MLTQLRYSFRNILLLRIQEVVHLTWPECYPVGGHGGIIRQSLNQACVVRRWLVEYVSENKNIEYRQVLNPNKERW